MAITIGLILVPGFSLLSYAAAIEPFRAANQLSGRDLYAWRHASPSNAAVRASNGVTILPDMRLGDRAQRLDLVLVCAGGNPTTFDHPPTLAWLRRLARTGVAVGGVSGGPVVLAKAGLLAGRRTAVHWEHAPALRETFPDIEVAASLVVIEPDRITCQGGISALDMAMALIARDHGAMLARQVGDWFLRERGGAETDDLPRVAGPGRAGVTDARLGAVLDAMERSLAEPPGREELARAVGLSIRQLERLCRRQLGRGLHGHGLHLRLGHARRLLRETDLPVREIALAAGFAAPSPFARAYRREFGLAPRQERRGAAGSDPSLGDRP